MSEPAPIILDVLSESDLAAYITDLLHRVSVDTEVFFFTEHIRTQSFSAKSMQRIMRQLVDTPEYSVRWSDEKGSTYSILCISDHTTISISLATSVSRWLRKFQHIDVRVAAARIPKC
jgi:hypothetical protein